MTNYDDLTRRRMARANPASAFVERVFFELMKLPKKDFDNVVYSVIGHVNDYEEYMKAKNMFTSLAWLESK